MTIQFHTGLVEFHVIFSTDDWIRVVFVTTNNAGVNFVDEPEELRRFTTIPERIPKSNVEACESGLNGMEYLSS